MRRLLEAARASNQAFRGLKGVDRHVLYLAAMTTGFRASELASLTPAAFNLDGEPPTVTLAAENAKNGRTAIQPLAPEAAAAPEGYLAGKPSGVVVWPGTWAEKAADMIRVDLDACGIPYAVEGPDGPLYADFHALRHSMIALLDKSGATLKEAMQLARHSDPKLTMAVYGRAALHDLGAAVERLPSLLASNQAASIRATGTDGDSGCSRVVVPIDLRRDGLTIPETADGDKAGNDIGPKPLQLQDFEADRDSVTTSETELPRAGLEPITR